MSWGGCRSYEELATSTKANKQLVELAKEFLWLQERHQEHKTQRDIHLADYQSTNEEVTRLLGLFNDSRGFHTYTKNDYIAAVDRRTRQAAYANEHVSYMNSRSRRMREINEKMSAIQ